MTTLTAGQKAAATRAANKLAAGGGLTLTSSPSALAKAKATEGNVRLSGLSLSLLVEVTDQAVVLRFEALNEEGKPFASGLSTNERGLTDLTWGGALCGDEVSASTVCQVSLYDARAEHVLTVGKLAVQLDKALADALEDSEDFSVSFLANWLASTFRVHQVKVIRDGQTAEHKRGSTYRVIFQLCDDLRPKALPAPKAPAKKAA